MRFFLFLFFVMGLALSPMSFENAYAQSVLGKINKGRSVNGLASRVVVLPNNVNIDFDGDCDIDEQDIAIFLAAFEQQQALADLTLDENFDLSDIALFLRLYNERSTLPNSECSGGDQPNLHDSDNGLPVTDAQYHVLFKSNYYGSIFPDGLAEYNENEDIMVTLTPNPGFKVERVMINGHEREVDGNSFTFYDVDDYAHVEVVFEPETFLEIVYVDGDLPQTCDGDYSVSARSCGGSDGIGFKTLQEAAQVAVAGTHVIVREGAYRDVGVDGGARGLIGMRLMHSGTAENPVMFSAYEGETVSIDGAKEINGFRECAGIAGCLDHPYEGKLFEAELSNDVDIPSAFVFRDDGTEVFRAAASPTTEDENAFNPNKKTDAWHTFPRADYVMNAENRIIGFRSVSILNAYDQQDLEAGYVYHWGCNNNVHLMKIASYDPQNGELLFEGSINCAPRDDGGAFKLYNILGALDEPGEYYIDEAHNKIYILVEDNELVANVEHGYLNKGIHLNTQDHIIIKGFEFTGITDVGLGGSGIINYNSGNNYEVDHITILDSKFYNMIGGAIDIAGSSYGFYGYNSVRDTGLGRAIKPDGGVGNIIVNNDLARVGRTGISYYGAVDSFIVGNTNVDSLGQHSNGITTYLSCDNILIFKNRVINSQISYTAQSSKNLTVIGNVFVNEGSKAIAAWNSNDPAENLTFIGNTVVGSTYVHEDDWGGHIIFKNNILEAVPLVATERSNNLHTDVPWWMPDDFDYGFYNESVEEDLDTVFENLDQFDFTPRNETMGDPLMNPCIFSTSGGHIGAISCK